MKNIKRYLLAIYILLLSICSALFFNFEYLTVILLIVSLVIAVIAFIDDILDNQDK